MRVSVCILLALCVVSAARAADVSPFHRVVPACGKSFVVRGVRANLRDPHVGVKLGLAWGAVGRTESLAGIAGRYRAIAAINGSFFDAYTKDELKNPDMALVTGGRLVFRSELGTLLGFEADNTPHIGNVKFRLGGQVDDTAAWYAYWVNRKPTAAECVTVFTREWGPRVEPMGGVSVVVRHGAVTEITEQAIATPTDGYVIHVRGLPAVLARFAPGRRVTLGARKDIVNGDTDDGTVWSRVDEAVGCGPRVLEDGAPVFRPTEEGFTDPKVLEAVATRSAVGYTRDRELYLITVRGARVYELGYILMALGCVEGMNLDGGASSGLWYRGEYLTRPGRAISNALLIVERP